MRKIIRACAKILLLVISGVPLKKRKIACTKKRSALKSFAIRIRFFHIATIISLSRVTALNRRPEADLSGRIAARKSLTQIKEDSHVSRNQYQLRGDRCLKQPRHFELDAAEEPQPALERIQDCQPRR